mgnify:CR=1 FL=1
MTTQHGLASVALAISTISLFIIAFFVGREETVTDKTHNAQDVICTYQQPTTLEDLYDHPEYDVCEGQGTEGDVICFCRRSDG